MGHFWKLGRSLRAHAHTIPFAGLQRRTLPAWASVSLAKQPRGPRPSPKCLAGTRISRKLLVVDSALT